MSVRKLWLPVVFFVFLVFGAGVAGCTRSRYQAQFFSSFDTVSQITAYDVSETHFEKQAKTAEEFLLEYHRLYDIYHTYEGINNLKTINDMAGKSAVQVDQRIIDLLIFAKEVYVLTDGKVNVTEGAVLRLWHEKREEAAENPESAAIPDAEALEEAAKHTDIQDLIIDEKAGTVFLRDPEMSLDVGGIAKGYAVEQLACFLKEEGMKSVLLNVGGNLRAVGMRGDEKYWVCPVESPFQDEAHPYTATVYLKDMALVTSGDYQRYYMVGEQRYHHIIDPDTLYPSEYHRSVSILAEDSALADALSTGIFLMPLEDGMKKIESMEGVEAVWTEPDGTVVFSSGFQKYTEQTS